MYFRTHSGDALTLAAVLALTVSMLLAALPASAANPQNDPAVYGYWKSVDKKTGKTQSIFKVYEDKGKLAGKIVKTFPRDGEKYDPKARCTECEGERKNQPVIGLVFFWGFVPEKNKPRKWVDGKILNPDDGKSYGSEAELSEDGQSLSVYGYIRILFKIGGTSVWKRPTAKELEGIEDV